MMALSRNVESRKNSESRLVSLTPTSVSAYLNRCIKRGLVKVSQAPARRYAYYLTPQGFAEKSRLTVEYLSSSFSFFRQAKADCTRVFQLARDQHFQNLVLCGKSDLAEIAILSDVDCGVSFVAIVDENADNMLFVGKQVISGYDRLTVPFDAVIVTDVVSAR